ncbi:uncharacterized protein N7458_009922 [Penicillium daleae]|uniref:Uncharacterized protein n=1 Tax=Penicillium daleae TaxID=63821 RepID=A0AAD6C0M8_9EURO|nr:uncharacterized protein N7458_009922 [Penicillium daleae]KAJ5438924.1 hypothetical protein N7458_009922 [Penicillium daleae]
MLNGRIRPLGTQLGALETFASEGGSSKGTPKLMNKTSALTVFTRTWVSNGPRKVMLALDSFATRVFLGHDPLQLPKAIVADHIVKGQLSPPIGSGKTAINNQTSNMQGKRLHHNSSIERVIGPTTLDALTLLPQKGFDRFALTLKTAFVGGIFHLAFLTESLDLVHFLRGSK